MTGLQARTSTAVRGSAHSGVQSRYGSVTALPRRTVIKAGGRGTHALPAPVTPPVAAGLTAPVPIVRLTRRGRYVLLALITLAVLAIFALGRVTAGASAAGPRRTVTVAAGDTLWSIAQRVAPQDDPRVEVALLTSANHLDPQADVAPGDVLVVPGS